MNTFGYYAHGVGAETAILPSGWRERLIRLENANTGGTTGLCLEVHDLAASKLVAGREKDRDFLSALMQGAVIDVNTLSERIEALPVGGEQMEVIRGRLKRMSSRI